MSFVLLLTAHPNTKLVNTAHHNVIDLPHRDHPCPEAQLSDAPSPYPPFSLLRTSAQKTKFCCNAAFTPIYRSPT